MVHPRGTRLRRARGRPRDYGRRSFTPARSLFLISLPGRSRTRLSRPRDATTARPNRGTKIRRPGRASLSLPCCCSYWPWPGARVSVTRKGGRAARCKATRYLPAQREGKSFRSIGLTARRSGASLLWVRRTIGLSTVRRQSPTTAFMSEATTAYCTPCLLTVTRSGLRGSTDR